MTPTDADRQRVLGIVVRVQSLYRDDNWLTFTDDIAAAIAAARAQALADCAAPGVNLDDPPLLMAKQYSKARFAKPVVIWDIEHERLLRIEASRAANLKQPQEPPHAP